MWLYKDVTREEFEQKKDEVERIIIALGGEIQHLTLPHENETASVFKGNETVCISTRPSYKFGELYFRVCEACFDKPYIVLECGTYEDLIHNRMEDADPFAYNLSDDLLVKEVKYSLGILPDQEE